MQELSTCVRDHPSCHERRTTATLPTRLLDITQYRNDILRLVETNEITTVADNRYTVLSYCSGTSNTIRLSPETSNELHQGFSTSKLPLTFRDAIEVTYNIGIQYLWFDALCVIQASEEDWVRESASMDSIYGNAFLALIAANASDCGDGFFQRSVLDEAPETNNPRDGFPYEEEPVNSRAWTLQEWELCPRRLVFASYRLIYTCDEHLRPGFRRDPFTGRCRTQLVPGANLHTWGTLVEKYSVRKLENPDDKLPALAGLAEKFASLTEGKYGRYLAGLWEEDLLRQLLWRQWNTVDLRAPVASRRPKTWRAPSWSWASIDGAISCMPLAPEKCSPATLVSAQATPASEVSSYGRITSGVIMIRGPSVVSCASEGLRADLIADSTGWTKLRWGKREFATVAFDTEDDGDVCGGPGKLHFLGILNATSKTWGLILTTAEHATFRRVGVFFTDDNSEWLQEEAASTYTII